VCFAVSFSGINGKVRQSSQVTGDVYENSTSGNPDFGCGAHRRGIRFRPFIFVRGSVSVIDYRSLGTRRQSGIQNARTTFLLAGLTITVFGQGQPPAAEPEIVTDRPDVTESSIVVPKNSLQSENGLTWTSDHGQQTLDLPKTLLRYGLLTRTELRFVVPNYFGSLTGRMAASGFDDLAVGFKQQLGPLPGGFELSVMPALSLPTGAKRISRHGFDPVVKFPWSKDLSDGWSIGGMQSVFWFTHDTRRSPTGEATFYVEKQLTKPWDIFAEYVGDYPKGGGPIQIAHFGTAFKVTHLHQVDFHFGFGLSHAAPERFIGVGYSFRFDKLWH
jgi:hypothetical protein